MKGTFIRVRKMEKESSNGKMEASMKEILLMDSFRVLESTSLQTSISGMWESLE